jgi:hypothetical protein
MKYLIPFVVLFLLPSWTVVTADETEAPVVWKAGAASTKITPERRLHMAGYAGRKEPVEGTEQDLFGKALAIEDREGNRVVLVTLDLNLSKLMNNEGRQR